MQYGRGGGFDITGASADIWKYMFHFADSMALKSAVELRIPDIIHRHSGPITLSQITASLSDSPSPDTAYLSSIRRLLVRRNIFSAHRPSDGAGDTLYVLTYSSQWLLSDSTVNLAPMLLMENPLTLLVPWHYLSHCVREGGVAFKKAHSREIWEMASENPELNKLFNNGMACTGRMATMAIVSSYKY